jgi:hypothetical protein
VVPALVNRLDDADPVVRLAAYEELRRRTGHDFGYVPWASPEDRAGAINRWRAEIGQAPVSTNREAPAEIPPQAPGKALPIGESAVPVS